MFDANRPLQSCPSGSLSGSPFMLFAARVCFGSLLLLAVAIGGCGFDPGNQPSAEPAPPASDSQANDQGEPNLSEAPPPPPEGAFIAQLTPEQNQKLLDLGIDVAIPTQIPSGFQAISVVTGTQAEGPSYMLIYQDQLNRCFAIEHTSGGVGGLPDIENKVPLNPSIFGEGYTLYHGVYTDPSLRADFPEANLISDWMGGSSGFYRLVGAAYLMQNYPELTCENLSPTEAVQVVDSLTYLQTEVIGDMIEGEPL